jgi:predicted dinucleotide-binding enzyme
VGFSAVEAGPLSNARYLEPLTELQIQLAYGLGHGTRIGFRLVALG